ncbi:hypothetical protein V3C99_012854 [Haemonchus contortus]
METKSKEENSSTSSLPDRNFPYKRRSPKPDVMSTMTLTVIVIFTLFDAAGSQITPSNTPVFERPNCENPQLDNRMREQFLDGHNQRRSSLARGETESNGNRTLIQNIRKHPRAGNYHSIAPPATNMYRMRYSCDAETYAQQHANSCNRTVQPPYARPGYKENTFVYRNPLATPAAAGLAAMADWWSELATYGMRTDMLFTQGVRTRETRRVTKWAKMAWWNNNLVGCGLKHCGKYYLVVCMYRPGGNDVGRKVYNIGPVCAECPTTCYEGLCN